MNNGFKILIVSLFISFTITGNAQQEPLFTQYMFNRVYYNPASAGVYSALNTGFFARQQWVGIENDNKAVNPQTYLISADMPIPSINCGTGLIAYYDKLGNETNLNFSLVFDYHMRIFDDHSLSAGVNVDFLQKKINYGEFILPDTLDPAWQFNSKENALFTDFGIGVFYHHRLNHYFGISAKRLLQPAKEVGPAEFQAHTHYYLTAGYNITLNNSRGNELTLTPSTLVKLTSHTTQFDMNLMLMYKYQYWGGLTYRTGGTAAITGGFRFDKYLFGVSYDLIANKLSKGNNAGSFELYVGYRWPLEIKTTEKRKLLNGKYNTRTM